MVSGRKKRNEVGTIPTFQDIEPLNTNISGNFTILDTSLEELYGNIDQLNAHLLCRTFYSKQHIVNL